MLNWLISVSEKCRELCEKAQEAVAHLEVKQDDAAKTINGYQKVQLNPSLAWDTEQVVADVF
jgi:hypothetical protein